MQAPIVLPSCPRLVPELPLPPYAYVPKGCYPHPTRDSDGHSYARAPLTFVAPDPAHWQESRPYLYGVDLFNHGYYWEAHDVWESLWHACGRQGTTADFLKALIALAAAGVKQREGSAGRGVQRHAARCRAILNGLARRLEPGVTHYLGLKRVALVEMSHRLSAGRAIGDERLDLLVAPDEAHVAHRASDD